MNDVPVAEETRIDRIVVLFSPELGKAVRELAARERRNISQQVQLLVEHALECTAKTTAAA